MPLFSLGRQGLFLFPAFFVAAKMSLFPAFSVSLQVVIRQSKSLPQLPVGLTRLLGVMAGNIKICGHLSRDAFIESKPLHMRGIVLAGGEPDGAP
jgi:hypothetical protein